jgi:hypothetical protein
MGHDTALIKNCVPTFRDNIMSLPLRADRAEVVDNLKMRILGCLETSDEVSRPRRRKSSVSNTKYC